MNDRIQVFDYEGNYLFHWGKYGRNDGDFRAPQGIAIQNELVYIAETWNNRIQIFDLNGKFIKKFGSNKDFNHPVGLALDSKRNFLYVVDTYNDSIKIFK